MLTRLIIRNFKRLGNVEIELGDSVVLVGPNNSGKSTALQALTLWDAGLRAWTAKRDIDAPSEKRPGVTINRKDLFALPTPTAKLLWHDLRTHVRNRKVRIEVIVEGVADNEEWTCGLEFDFSNSESLACRPLRREGFEEARVENAEFTTVPPHATSTRVAFLPPMSGLAEREHVKQRGEIEYLIGQGQTALVLRNLCRQVREGAPDRWDRIVDRIDRVFGVMLDAPSVDPSRSEITLAYRERTRVNGNRSLDLSSAGRGLQQTLLLLAHLHAHPGTALLLDEPDAHLEILRQRQIYELLKEEAVATRCQVIAATHSEVVLNDAADTDIVISFVGRPHRIDDRGQGVIASLKEIGFDEYYQAEITGWVLYLEGATDLRILHAFARRLDHPAARVLERPFVHYIGNRLTRGIEHFMRLREAKPDLAAVAILDQDASRPKPPEPFLLGNWRRKEIENYLCQPDTLIAYARGDDPEDLFARAREEKMRAVVGDQIAPAMLRDASHPGWVSTKASDQILAPIMADYHQRLGLPNLMLKRDYHVLAAFVPLDLMDTTEIREKLDLIVDASRRARPLMDDAEG